MLIYVVLNCYFIHTYVIIYFLPVFMFYHKCCWLRWRWNFLDDRFLFFFVSIVLNYFRVPLDMKNLKYLKKSWNLSWSHEKLIKNLKNLKKSWNFRKITPMPRFLNNSPGRFQEMKFKESYIPVRKLQKIMKISWKKYNFHENIMKKSWNLMSKF